MVDAADTESGLKFFRPLAIRNFRLLWIGSALSMLGGQLTMIAFPWLVLRLTGDSFAMGAVLAASGVPRALLMIFGGAFYRSIYAAADADLDELDSDGIDAYSGDTSVHRHYRDVDGFCGGHCIRCRGCFYLASLQRYFTSITAARTVSLLVTR